jgi:hypothetical protein
MLWRLVNFLTASRRLRQRGLFRFWDGRRWRYADPFKCWREINNHEKLNMESMADDIDAGNEPETSIALNAVCEVFGVERWSDKTRRGLTDSELLNLLADFQEFLELLKKSGSPGPTSSEVSATFQSSTSPELPDEATKPLSDSGSAPSESNSASPTEPSAASVPG